MQIGAVVIGRNEQQFLQECLESLRNHFQWIVYVDSGSTDSSIAIAKNTGVKIVELSASALITAARARCAGFESLCALAPEIELVQFIDADCVLDPHWPAAAISRLAGNPRLAALAGRRTERYPRASIYNLICQLEWGQAGAHFGGDVLVRASAYRSAGGYDPAMIAAEDHELSQRLLDHGCQIESIDIPMTLHDSRMHYFSQWWRRCLRRGVGYGQMWQRHHLPSDTRAIARIFLWAALLPLLILLFAWPSRGLSFIALMVYPLRALRIGISFHRRGGTIHDAAIWAI